MTKTKTKVPFIKPFRVGDVVRFTEKSVQTGYRDREEHVIESVDTNRLEINKYKYSTHSSAWHDHADLELIRECDEESMKLLIQSIQDENESYYEK